MEYPTVERGKISLQKGFLVDGEAFAIVAGLSGYVVGFFLLLIWVQPEAALVYVGFSAFLGVMGIMTEGELMAFLVGGFFMWIIVLICLICSVIGMPQLF